MVIVYKDMCFCTRKGCPIKTCPRNLAQVDWSAGLPVSVSDFWSKRPECPSFPPDMMKIKEAEPDA